MDLKPHSRLSENVISGIEEQSGIYIRDDSKNVWSSDNGGMLKLDLREDMPRWMISPPPGTVYSWQYDIDKIPRYIQGFLETLGYNTTWVNYSKHFTLHKPLCPDKVNDWSYEIVKCYYPTNPRRYEPSRKCTSYRRRSVTTFRIVEQ